MIAPVFAPLGLRRLENLDGIDYRLHGKGERCSNSDGSDGWYQRSHRLLTPLAAAALLVFCLLYTPCVAAITSIKRELGGKWAALVVVHAVRDRVAVRFCGLY